MAKIASMRRILDRSPSCPSSARPAGQSLPWTQRQRLRETVARRPAVSARAPSATDLIREAAEPLPEPDDPAFGAMFDRFAKARVVLLGEATHGTSEFYRARAQITRRLIERHGFNIVAIEADWPDAARIDRYVRHKAVHVGSGPAFRQSATCIDSHAHSAHPRPCLV
jgi:hypothetical protein